MTTAETKACCVEKCKRPYRAKGYCSIHFRKWRRGELEAKSRYKTCTQEGCRKPRGRHGMCTEHYTSWAAARKGVTGEVAVPAAGTSPAEAAPTEVVEEKTEETVPEGENA